MMISSPTIGMSQDRFLTRFQQDQVDRAFWDELKHKSANPHRLHRSTDAHYFQRAEELKKNTRQKGEPTGEDLLNVGAEMKSMVGVRPNPEIAAHQKYHERWVELREKVIEPEKEEDSLIGSAGKKINQLRDDDTDWFMRNSADMAEGLGMVGNIAGGLGLVTGGAALGLMITGVGAPVGAILGGATTVLTVASIAAKTLQGTVVGFDPRTPAGSGISLFKEAAVDAALFGVGKVVKGVGEGAKALASTERMAGLAFLKDWRGMTFTALKSIDRMTAFLNSKLDIRRLQRIFGPSGLLTGPLADKMKTYERLATMLKLQEIAEWVKDAFEHGGRVVKAFLAGISTVANFVGDAFTDGKEAIADFVNQTGSQMSTAVKDAAIWLFEQGVETSELLLKWGVNRWQDLSSMGHHAWDFGVKVAEKGKRIGRKAVGTGLTGLGRIAKGMHTGLLLALLRANLIRRRLLATGAEIFEWVSERTAPILERLMQILAPGVDFTRDRIGELVNVAELIFGRVSHAGSEFVGRILGAADRLLGAPSRAAKGFLGRIFDVVKGGIRAGVGMLTHVLERGRAFGEGVLDHAMEFYGGLLSRIGSRISGTIERVTDTLMRLVGVSGGMVRHRINDAQDLLARLTENGAGGLLRLNESVGRMALGVVGRAGGLGHTAADVLANFGGAVISRGAGIAQSLVTGGLSLVNRVIGRGTGMLVQGITRGAALGTGMTNLVERMMTRPVGMALPYLPPFAVPLANRYLAGAAAIGRGIRDTIGSVGAGATNGVGFLSQLIQHVTGRGASMVRRGITAGQGFLNGVIDRGAGFAHRAVSRGVDRAQSFVGGVMSRVTGAVQRTANLAHRLITNPAGVAHTGITGMLGRVASMVSSTAQNAQAIVDRGASMLGASATNPVVAGAHAAVSFAESTVNRAQGVLGGAVDTVFGWLQREGSGSEPAVANPVGLAQSLKQKERPVHLPPSVREMLASQLGFDPSLVRIHAGAESGRAASSLKAEAFTIGSDIFFNPGQYDPHSTRGKSLLAHELTHVVQQSQGRSSAQQFRDSGGDAMEREAQEQGRAMALAVRDRRLGGIDAHEVELRRADGAVVSDDDQNRLARIQELTEAKVITKAANAGITRLISASVNVDVILDLDRMSDDEAAELWSQQIVASVQTTAEPSRSPRSTLQRSVQSDLNSSAQARLGVAPGMPPPSDIDLNRRRTQQYADMYLTNPAVFKWAGLAAFASRLVGQGIAGSQLGHAAAPALMATGTGPGMAAGAALAANPLDRALLQGNRLIYDNIFWMHMAYQQGGIERIRQAHTEGSVPDDMLAAWELIQEGRDTNDDTKIWQGNREFARYEQQVIVQPIYDQHPMLFGAMSAGMVSPAPGMEPGMRMPYDGEFLQQASPGANIGNSQDRWNWVDNQMLPHWQALETQQPERIRYLVQELRESGGLVNTFEDSDIREGVATRSAEDLAGVAGTERVRMVNRLLSGWIADEDVDAAVRLLETIQSEEELEQVAGGIADSMDGMWSSRQRARLQLALARARAKPKTPAQTPSKPRLSNNPRRQNVSPSRHSNRQPRTNRPGHRNPAQPEPASRTEPNEQQRSPVQRESRSNVDAVRAAQIAELAHAQRLAEFADDTYQGSGAPTGSTRLDGDPAELQAMGLTPGDFHDPDSGFDAAVYREAGTGRIIIAYRGTEADSMRDWRTNAGQGVGMDMEQYRRAATLARAIRRAYPDAPMEITGHSLGGGLATLASAATGIPATTFNAANVHPDTYGYSGADPSWVPVGSTNYTVDGEPLTAFQGYAPTIGTGLGGVALSPFGPGGVIGGGLMGRRMGENIGSSPLRHVTMEARNADGSEMGTFEHSGGHGMAGVRGALEHRRSELEPDTGGAQGSW